MLFNLKKFFGALLMPLPLLMLLMGLALLLLWFTRWQKSGKTIFTLSWLFLLLFSLQPAADRSRIPDLSRQRSGQLHRGVGRGLYLQSRLGT